MSGATEHWFRTQMAAAVLPTSTPSGIRRVIENVHFSWDVDLLRELEITFPGLGYSSYKTKMRQLDRNYWDEESWQAALERIASRPKVPTCIGINMRGADKESRSQGHCMMGAALYSQGKGAPLVLNIFYRSTELFQKHTADLLWLRDRIPKNVETIRFHIATAYQSGLYFPIVARYSARPHLLLKAFDEVGRVVVGRGVQPYLDVDEERHTYPPTVRMREYFLEHVSSSKQKLIDAWCPKLKRQLRSEEMAEDDDE